MTQAVWKLESLSTTQKVVLPAGQKAFNHADRAVGIAHRKNNVLCISSACDFSHSLDPFETCPMSTAADCQCKRIAR
jgi:hypothetical protein